MKKDIDFSPVTGVELVITQSENEENAQWDVYLINKNLIELTTVMITSKAQVELAQCAHSSVPLLFLLNNEYWVSYFILDQIFDKKFVFVPDSIQKENLQYIPELDLMGVRHA